MKNIKVENDHIDVIITTKMARMKKVARNARKVISLRRKVENMTRIGEPLYRISFVRTATAVRKCFLCLPPLMDFLSRRR